MVDESQNQLEMNLARKAIKQNIPLLGLCGDAGSTVCQVGRSFKIFRPMIHKRLSMNSQPTQQPLGMRSIWKADDG